MNLKLKTIMKYLQERINKFADSLKENKDCSSVSNYTGAHDDDFKIYNAISGFLKGSYFSLYFSVWGNETALELKIYSTTDCKPQIKEILNQYGFTPTK